MKRKAVAHGIYVDQKGRFWCRPWVNGRRTNRLLRATRVKEATLEVAKEKFKSGKDSFSELVTRYVDAGCPDRHFNERTVTFIDAERIRARNLVKFFGGMSISEIRPMHCPDYKRWRIKSIKKGTGERTVDMDLITLSNILTYGVSTNHIEINVLKFGKPVFRKSSAIRRSREVAPTAGDQVHAIARLLFDEPISAVLGWQTLFAAYTGCRTSELLRLRMDAKTPDDAGFVSGNYLFLGRRSKRGVNPWVPIVGCFAEMFAAFMAWRTRLRAPSPWFFVDRTGTDCVGSESLNHALKRATAALGFHHVTPHGLRSFYVTRRRSEGALDSQIAAEIGDSTVGVIPTSYGDLPANWNGGAKLSPVPNHAPVAWNSLDSKRPFYETMENSITV